MASLSDLDTSSESEYDSGQDSTSEMNKDSNDETLKPKCNTPNSEDFENAPWGPTAQLHAAQLHANELHARQLAQLHAKIKA
jgi:hypothetical protein